MLMEWSATGCVEQINDPGVRSQLRSPRQTPRRQAGSKPLDLAANSVPILISIV